MTTVPGILFQRLDDVAKITLSQPETLNALTPEMVSGLPGVLARAAADGARAVIITGAGRAFSSGARLTPPPSGRAVDAGEQFKRYGDLARALSDLPIPLVTAINGPAAGGGASIALAGDIILAARSSYLMLAFSRIALPPDLGATWLVARAAGRVKALEMALLGERVSAEEAYRSGLVTRVVDDTQLMQSAEEVAAQLTAMPTRTLGLIRLQVRAALESTFEASLGVETDHARLCIETEDFREGTAAFREKRAPKFIGR
jgi:2-(1,2-epoxy-1,2-dihydrophenyl)acetyl-CoA isomerase